MNDMPLEKPQHHIAVLADQCVQCGLCLPVCPTYALDGNEAESPRGRIAIAAALARGQIAPSPELREPLDHCLGCLSCQRVCPAGVQYEELLVETRALLGPSPQRPGLLLDIAKRPKLNRWLQRWARWTGAAIWLPALLPGKQFAAWRAAISLLKSPTPLARTQLAKQPGTRDAGIVALFPGCAASVQDAAAERAAEQLLDAAGYRVVRLPATCCGALDLHDGDAAGAEVSAKRLRDAWDGTHADYLVSVTPGCLSTLRRALTTVQVEDPYRLLAERAEKLRFRPLNLRAGLHIPCTQSNVARSETALIKLLERIPGLALQRLSTPPYCCGAAGSHVLQFPERAERLRDDVLSHIHTLDVQMLLSSNIGCRLHLAAGLAAQASTLPTMHPLTLLAQQQET
ncbi:(Fe-S)-binding protein [Dyella mobilis]|uniref:Glycolate oxidase iron-sulfur subunit n=1 Tax=Dyella mobilis TaxID=1849582 RepID=A0ABS2KII5_9GAMM|nr:(Fe-S)-binding protein [Dyella mobilis]MBM7130193.1 (Fe-S)-binding protein [Dyella mobilis]GLQ96819.1 glycolate oxidase iron-sulfur subunit [Dyella mobilis]